MSSNDGSIVIERTIKWTTERDNWPTMQASGGGWHIVVSAWNDEGAQWGICAMWADDLRYRGVNNHIARFASLPEATAAVEAFIQRYWGVMPVEYIEGRANELFADYQAEAA